MDDLHILDAFVVDGTGAPGRTADVAVRDGRIVEVGTATGTARRVVDAGGGLLTPGFVDIHTHFDGQVCWDKQVTPSSWHGVTTVVMGNCGVGFAPVRPGTEGELVALMESVEDIPGTALHEGIPWGWESFGEYLDTIDTPYSVDIGAQIPHVALRYYVMGDRCYDDATAADIAAMADLSRAALADGALGFSTSRFYGHRNKAGEVVPGTHASADEMVAIGEALRDSGHGTMEIISDHIEQPDELAWIEHIARLTGRPVTLLSGAPMEGKLWELATRLAADGVQLRPQVGARPASVLMTLEGTLNPLRQFRVYSEIKDLPLADQRAALRDSSFRARLVADDQRVHRFSDTNTILSTWHRMYVLPADLGYEPTYHDSLAGIAEAQGIHVREALMDVMADGRPLLFLFGNYPGHLDGQVDAINHPQSVFGLSDGGAHCGVLCDASVPTYMLAYMTRDRPRGTMPLEHVVHKMTLDTARVYGLRDRGVVASGYRADLNLIDYDALRLHDPELVHDLPAGGKRIIQRASGYRMTVCAGEVTYQDGEHTGAMPGRLVRGGR
ncbi:MAG: Amidohydrolase [Ilumatobacteraceae bacterium]|nr:Amidohydrolase [Ilumatobacteraceae bacterium]